jgi:ParB-like chromosome segregation protein Spo0J
MSKKPTEKNYDGPALVCEHTRLERVENLKPYPRNNRAHGDEQTALLAANIRKLGWRWPIIVSRQSGYIVAGHGRLEAAKLLGVAVVPVVDQDFADPRLEEAFRLADNRLPELADIQTAAIKDILQELDDGQFDMKLTGYSEAEIERLMNQCHIPDENKLIDEATMAETLHECPKCGFKW